MDIYKILKEQLNTSDPWKGLAFVLACAERIEPIVEEFAYEDTKEMYKRLLSDLWCSCAGNNVDFFKIY